LIKEFFILFSVMMLLTGGMLLHYATYDNTATQSALVRVVGVTKLSSPAFSVAYYEPRIYLYDESINSAYPQMQPISKMDLVYEK